MADVVKVPVGLQDVYYAKLIKDDKSGVEYDTPKLLALAITANVTPTINSATLFANDGPVVTANALGEITVEIGVPDISFEDYAILLGARLNDKGMLIDNADDQAPEVALGYKRTYNDGSIRYIWLLKGKFQLPTDEATTKQGEITFQTPTIQAKFLKRIHDGNWRFRADSSNPDSADLITSWFSAVPDDVPDTIPTP
ncbi:major tail protein [Paenibacillus ihumii]|uniref:major tail protein n=1 Tax=Paenibacillus ihumii TaxID=687436 RepID=UPI0006D82C4D|nr:major tail protein [Paenibacillus ihumii]